MLHKPRGIGGDGILQLDPLARLSRIPQKHLRRMLPLKSHMQNTGHWCFVWFHFHKCYTNQYYNKYLSSPSWTTHPCPTCCMLAALTERSSPRRTGSVCVVRSSSAPCRHRRPQLCYGRCSHSHLLLLFKMF